MTEVKPEKKTLFAQEGFISTEEADRIMDPSVRIINIHVLSDGIAFSSVPMESRQRMRMFR
ncbi:MAG TPA: hypothetical protein ENN03_06100 [bacterium]|nr:hypothetical protein [bacterium]